MTNKDLTSIITDFLASFIPTNIYNDGKDLPSFGYEVLRNIPLFAGIMESVDTSSPESLWNGIAWYAFLTPLVYARNKVRHLRL